eukprot:g7370.t1
MKRLAWLCGALVAFSLLAATATSDGGSGNLLGISMTEQPSDSGLKLPGMRPQGRSHCLGARAGSPGPQGAAATVAPELAPRHTTSDTGCTTPTTDRADTFTCPENDVDKSSTVLGASLPLQGTPARWAHGWWLDGTTWVSCSSMESNCFGVADFDSDTEHGLADLGAGHAHPPFGSILGVGVLPDVFDGLSSIGGVVANALLMTPLLRRAVNWLGVRRASSAGIVQMFKDGIQAVGVVTGGIHEMFVSQQKERIIAPRPNFARLALQPFGSILGVGVLPDVFDGLSSIGGVVANALLMTPLLRRAVNWLGVRRASSAGIVQMFKDGIQAVGVVTGGIHEMFVSQQKERIIAPRPNFARLALQYGVPLLMGHGAFLLIPFRETLHMVVSKPIAVGKVANPTDDDVQVVQKRVETELCGLYYRYRPEWETRPLELLRGAASPQELELAREQASAVDRRP